MTSSLISGFSFDATVIVVSPSLRAVIVKVFSLMVAEATSASLDVTVKSNLAVAGATPKVKDTLLPTTKE